MKRSSTRGRHSCASTSTCLAERLVDATDWLTQFPDTKDLRIGYFGASTGAAAALAAAALQAPIPVGAIVLARRPPRPRRRGLDPRSSPHAAYRRRKTTKQVIQLNRAALAQLRCEKQLVIVPGATHLFEEPGALDVVARLARDWFERHLIAMVRSHRDLVRGVGTLQLRHRWPLSGAGTHDGVGNLPASRLWSARADAASIHVKFALTEVKLGLRAGR